MKKMVAFVISVLIFYSSLWLEPVHGSTFEKKNMQDQDKKIILISIPGLSFREMEPAFLRNYPHLNHIVHNGAIGALNIRTPYKGIEDSYLTFGAGAPASSADTYHGLHMDELKFGESASVLYQRYNGKLPPSGEIIVPEIAAIHQMNAKESQRAQPGLLGSLLNQSGINTVVLGNRDRGMTSVEESVNAKLKRSASFLLMNQEGIVPNGVVDDRTLIADTERPFSVKTHYSFIREQITKQSGRAVILVELGDLDRLYAEKNQYAPHQFKHLNTQIMREMDQFIGEVVEQFDANDSLWIFSPQVHSDAIEDKALLAPFILYPSHIGQSLLTSNTTHRLGFIANVDLAPTLLNAFQLPISNQFRGSSIQQAPFGNEMSLEWLHKELTSIQHVYKLRPKLLYSFVTYEMIVLLLGLVFAIFVRNSFSRWMRIPLLSILFAPIILLYLQSISSLSIPWVIFCFYVLILTLSWFMVRSFPILPTMGILSAVTVVLLLIDGFMGAEAMKRSVLGYDPMIGARYYGMGNEYMGVLVGATILAVSLGVHFLHSVQRKRMAILAGVIFMIVIVYLATPLWGSNAGGTISACVAFGITWIRLFSGQALAQIRWTKLLFYIAGFSVVSLLGLWLMNSVLTTDVTKQSHIGRAFSHLFAGDWHAIQAIIVRKWSMNWHLLSVSSWSKVLMTSLFVMAVIILRPRGVFRHWQQQFPLIMYGFSAITVGSIIALFVNDSGIVAAGTMIVYVAVPMLCLKLDTQ